MKILRDQTFWLGFMTAAAAGFFCLFVGMAQDKVSFNGSGSAAPARVAAPTPTQGNGQQAPAMPRDAAIAAAETAKVNVKKFEKCVDEGKYTAFIKDEIAKANAAGAQGTPYSIAIKGDKMAVINGAQPLNQIIAIIDGLDSAPALTDIEVAPVTDADHFRGPKDAPITIVEYSDIDCPFCKRFHTSMKDLIAQRDDVKWVYRHLPLAQLHPNAEFKAEASECAAEIGGNDKFWTFLDAIIGA